MAKPITSITFLDNVMSVLFSNGQQDDWNLAYVIGPVSTIIAPIPTSNVPGEVVSEVRGGVNAASAIFRKPTTEDTTTLVIDIRDVASPVYATAQELADDITDNIPTGGMGGDVTIQLQDSGGIPIGAPDVYASGTVTTKTAPDGKVRTTDGLVPIMSVKSNGTADLPTSIIAYINAAGVPAITRSYATEYASSKIQPGVVFPRRELKNSANVGLGLWVALDQLALDTLPQVPDGSFQRKDSAGANIGSPIAVKSNETGVVATCPDATVKTTDGLTSIGTIKSNASGNLPQSVIKYKDAANVSQVTAASDTEFVSGSLRPATEVPRRELKYTNGTGTGIFATVAHLIADTVPVIPLTYLQGWAAGNADSIGVVLPAAYQGVPLSFVSETGSSGTITVSVNNGSSFAAPPFTAGVAKVIFRRTTIIADSVATFSS